MPPVPGWLVEGLWVVEKVSGDLFRVTKVSRNFVSCRTQDGSKAHKTRLDYLSKLFFCLQLLQV